MESTNMYVYINQNKLFTSELEQAKTEFGCSF